MSTRAKIAAAGLLAATLPVAVAATVSAETSPTTTASTPGSTSATSASPSDAATSTTSTATSSASTSTSGPSTTPGAHVEKPIELKLKGNQIDTASVPDAASVFTRSELAPILPKLTAVKADDDTLDLTISGEPSDDRSHLVVDVPHAGAWKDVAEAWDRDKAAHQKRAGANPGLYTFFGSVTHGVSDSFTDGTTTYVLVHEGEAGATIRFAGIGFTTLADSHEDSRHDYTAKVVPALVELLGAKVHDGAQQTNTSASAAPSASSSSAASASSSSQSAAASSSSTS